MMAATSRSGVSGRNRVPTPAINPAARAAYSTLLLRGRCELLARKPGISIRRRATTKAQQASPVHKGAHTSVSGTAAYFAVKGHKAASQRAAEDTRLFGAESPVVV